jgi:cytochrome P450
MSVMAAVDHRIPKDVADLLAQPAAYADGRIHEAYKWLRANEPLGVADIDGIDPFWVVTRHEDILEVSRQNDLFHNGDRSPTLTTQAVDAKVRAMMGGSPHLLRTLIHMDAPDHRKYRALTRAGSCRRTCATWRARSGSSPRRRSNGWRRPADTAISSRKSPCTTPCT